MANTGGRSGRGAGRPRPGHGAARRSARQGATSGHRAGKPRDRAATGGKPRSVPPTSAATESQRTFRLGAVPGATPGKWIDTWKQRMPHVPLELVPIEVADQRDAIEGLDAALVRLPLPDADLHLIPLYEEVPVVVAASDSALMAVDSLTPADLDGEVLLTPADHVLGPLELPGTVSPDFAAPATTADAVAIVAAGVGIVVVPMSLARLHHRKDTDYRPLVDGPSSVVALAWLRERTTPDVEAFVGIVRGRTANSSR